MTSSEHSTRVLIVISNLTFGGAERQVVEIANHLDAEGFESHVCILSNHAPLAKYLRYPERLHVIPKRGKFDLTVVPRLAKLIRKLDVRLVHGFLFDAETTCRLVRVLTFGRLIVVGSERNSVHVYKRIQMIVFQLTKRLLSAVVANSQAGLAYNQQTFGRLNIPYFVVHNGVDTCRFSPAVKSSLETEFRIEEQHKVIGMFGSFKPQKNHPYMLEMMSNLVEQEPNVLLLLVGATVFEGDDSSAAYFERVKAEVAERGLQDVIRFVGARDDVERVYPLCRVTILPSLFEGTPNVALESMASGVPVVATDVADNKEVIPDGEVGYVVPLDDARLFATRVASLIGDEEHRRRLSGTAREWVVANYSNAVMTNKLATIYRNLMGAGGKVV